VTLERSRHVETRDRYFLFASVTTRWKDNDVYGHINNTVYNAWMDTSVTQFFRRYWPKMPNTTFIPVAVETHFTFCQPITHPADIETGLRVEKIGNSSVQCGVAIFIRGDSDAAAWGHMIHVWVNRDTNQPISIPCEVRQGLESALAR